MKKLTFKSGVRKIISIILCLAILITATLSTDIVYATGGSFTGGQICTGYRLKVKYSESAKDAKANTSKVKVTLYLVQDKKYDLYIGTRSATITINGTKTTISNIPAIQNTGGVITKLGTASATVKHKANGSKSIAIEGTFDMKATLAGTYYGTMKTSKKIELDNLDRTAPMVSLKYNNSTANSVSLTATANTTCDNWQYSTNGGSSWVTFGVSGTSNTFTISNLSGGTSYTVIVRARKTSNNVTSSNSSTVTATTKPAPPGGLAVSNIMQTSSVLTWGAVTGATSYKVYANGYLKASGLTVKNYSFTGLTANTSYRFGVCATGAGGDSSVSTSANYITLPNVPNELNVIEQTDDSVRLSWSQNNGGNAVATTFNIYRDGILIGTSSTTSYTDTTYKNTDCNYTVSASTSAGTSAKSSLVNVKHIPLSVELSYNNNSTYATITPKFHGGLNREVDYTSLKWAYGSREAGYFAENGNAFTNSFAVVQNGIYTVFAKDGSGNESVSTVVISGIYTKSRKGACVETFTDLSVDSVGLPIEFVRTYNSLDNTDNIFGNGWSLNYAKSTFLSDDGTVRLVYLPDGTINYFRVVENGYEAIRTQNTLIDAGYKLELITTEKIKYTYENNHLTCIEDANGNLVRIELNSDNLPVRITDTANRVYTIDYNNDKITNITDPAGRAFSYIYDNNGNLIEQRKSDGALVNKFIYTNGMLTKIIDSLNNTVCSMTYNSQNQILNITDNEKNTKYYLYKITNNGEIVVYESDSEIVMDELDYTTHPASNTYNSYEQTIIDSDGYVYEYNSDGTIDKIDGVNSDKTIVEYKYDEKGNILSVGKNELSVDETTGEITNSKIKEEISYVYSYFDGTCDISSETENVVIYTYDESGSISEKDKETNVTTYDIAGNILSKRIQNSGGDRTTSYTYDSKGMMLSEITDDVITEYTYNTYGYVISVKRREDGVETNSTYGYNIIGQIVTQKEDGLTTDNIYDLSGNVIKTTEGDGKTLRISRVVYNTEGNVTQKISNDQYDELYDGLKPDKNFICEENVYNNGTVGERYAYDKKGNVITYINESGNRTANIYDKKNRLVKTVTYELTGGETNSLTTRYVYDKEGNLVQTIYPHQYKSENDNLDVSFGINEYMDSKTGERSTYDENGNVLTNIDSFGKETINTYDSNDNLVKSVSGNEITRYVYNGGDKLIQVIYPEQYNAKDDNLNLSGETPVDTYANANVGERYTYDYDGNILTHKNQFDEITTNNYDGSGNLISTIKSDGTVFNFDEKGRVKKEIYVNGLERKFKHTSKQSIITGDNGINITYNLNAFGEVKEYKLQNGENNKNYSYTYDSDGNITTISLNDSLQQTFTYNYSNEIVRVDDAVMNKSVTYDYDYVGNITAIKIYDYNLGTLGDKISTEKYTYNSKNQRTDLSYDESGNLISHKGFKYNWNGRRLISFTSTDKCISYTYNHNSIRTSKTVNGITTFYKMDENNNVVKQYELENDVETNVIEFVYDSENTPVYFVYNEMIYYYEKNIQGDIVSIVDENGNTVVEYIYNIWGELCEIIGELADTIGVANPLRYRGYYYDTEVGLYYLQSRYYAPDLMRFISQDDVKLSNAQGEPLGSNLYVYCLNNPVNDSDPVGMFSINSVLKFVKSLGWKALKLTSKIWSAFKKPGKVYLKPFEIVLDYIIMTLTPSVGVALKALTYKVVNKQLVQIAFKNAGKSLITTLSKIGLNIGLNKLFSAAVNNLIFKHTSRFLTVGGIMCIIIDVIDGKIDYWFNYRKRM